MSIRKRRKDGSAFPPPEPIAGNGLLDRRALLGRGIVSRRRSYHWREHRAHQRRRRAADKWSMEPRAGRAYPAVWPAVKVRAEGGAHAEQSEARTPRQRYQRSLTRLRVVDQFDCGTSSTICNTMNDGV